MNGSLTSLNTAVAVVGEVWERAVPPFGVDVAGDVAAVVGLLDDGGLLALVDVVAVLGRRVDAVAAALAGEVAVRSPLGSRSGSLAHREGFGSPARLVAAASGGPLSRAAALAAVGRGTSPRRSLTGEVLPPAHPHVGAAVRGGVISVEAAHLIIGMLDRVASRVVPEVVDAAEELLTEKASVFPYADLVGLVSRAEARLDTDGVEPREEVLRQGRSLVMVQEKSGMFRLRGRFDPETGAPIKAALDAYVGNALRVARGHNHPGAGEGDDANACGCTTGGGADRAGVRVMSETRSSAQICADGLADFARHVLSCTDRVPGLPATTLVVRMDVEDLQDREGGCGFATLDGIDQPVSVATARRVACTAGLLPAVFGGASLPLDLGREARLFSRYQFLALWERDRGCASCGQTTFVEAHHAGVDWAKGGRTDLSDGVLLCSRCHHRVHRHEWEIRIDRSGVWFIPPPSIDPSRTRRPGVARQNLRERNRHQHES